MLQYVESNKLMDLSILKDSWIILFTVKTWRFWRWSKRATEIAKNQSTVWCIQQFVAAEVKSHRIRKKNLHTKKVEQKER